MGYGYSSTDARCRFGSRYLDEELSALDCLDDYLAVRIWLKDYSESYRNENHERTGALGAEKLLNHNLLAVTFDQK